MSSAEIASEEQKAENAKIAAEDLSKMFGAGEQQAETDAFQCGHCKQRKCRYRQQQTRSADEPMTTFVTSVISRSLNFCRSLTNCCPSTCAGVLCVIIDGSSRN
ncbi:hypothetical protein LXA43DRAFT_190977 [Ganoderma leucocontextum]|nr:hypothetical protein LXA43DRAFT_190977 [Ganoderma leucocontextum]